MTEFDNPVRVTHLVPEENRDAAQANTERGELSEAVRRVYQLYANGGSYDEMAELEHELEMVRKDRERIEEQVGDLEARISELDERERELESQLEAVAEERSEFEHALEELEAEVKEGMHVFPEHGRVQDVAAMDSREPEAVIELLKERNPDIPEHAFEARHEAGKSWSGLPSALR